MTTERRQQERRSGLERRIVSDDDFNHRVGCKNKTLQCCADRDSDRRIRNSDRRQKERRTTLMGFVHNDRRASRAARNVAPGREYPWTEETMQRINVLTPKIKEKAFSLDWFLLRQRFEQIEDLARKDPASCETTAAGEGRSWHNLAKLIVAEIYRQDADLYCPGEITKTEAILNRALAASPTRTQPATEAEAEAWCKESEHDFDIVTEHGNGKVTVHFDQIYRGMAEFCNHRAATPAAEKEGE